MQQLFQTLGFQKDGRKVHHCEAPQNHNVYIYDIHNTYIMIYKHNTWNVADRETTLKLMYYDTKDNLCDTMYIMYDAGTLEPWLFNLFKPFVEDDLDEEKEAEIKRISFKRIELLAFNNRYKPMQIQKQMEKEK